MRELTKMKTQYDKQEANKEGREIAKKRLENNYKRKISQYEEGKSKYTLNAPSMSDAQLKSEQDKLVKIQQQIMEMEQTLQQSLYQFSQQQEQEYMMVKAAEMEKYYLKVQQFCQSFAQTLGFDFILIYQNGGSILYSNTSYDISNYVVDAINKEYTQNKSQSTEVK